MEVFAGFGEYADYEIGRLIQAIEDLGQLDNTLDLLHRRRQRRERRRHHERPVQRDDLLQRRARNRRRTSSSTTTNWAARTPTATTPPAGPWRAIRRSPGRSRSPAATAAPATAWSSTGPRGSRPRAKCARSGTTSSTSRRPSSKRPACPSRRAVNGTPQTPIEGVSMVYTFADAKATRPAQDAVLRDLRQPRHLPRRLAGPHRPPGGLGIQAAASAPRRQVGTLRHVEKDFSSANDLAAKNPEKLKELQELFLKEAVKYHVLPLDDRTLERSNAALVGRPDLMAGRTSLTVYEGMIGMTENVFINTKNRSHTITAEVEIPKGGANGVILAQAGRFGGWSLYVKDGKPMYTYNFLGLQRVQGRRRRRRCRPARRPSASSSPTTAAASARAARARSSSTAKKVAEGTDRTHPGLCLLGRRRRRRRRG